MAAASMESCQFVVLRSPGRPCGRATGYGPPPNCGRKCSSDSDCQTGGFVQYPTCYVNSGTMCHGYCGP